MKKAFLVHMVHTQLNISTYSCSCFYKYEWLICGGKERRKMFHFVALCNFEACEHITSRITNCIYNLFSIILKGKTKPMYRVKGCMKEKTL